MAKAKSAWRKLDEKSLVPVVSVVVGVLLVIVAAMSLLMKPIADDVGFFADAEAGFNRTVVGRWQNDSGRIGQYFTIFASYKIFGERAVNVMPVAIIIFITGMTAWLLYQTAVLRDKKLCLLLGGLFALTGAFLCPSIFDSLLWYDSAACFMMSVGATLCVINLVVFVAKKPRRWWVAILSCLAVVFFATFSELAAGAMMAGGAVAFGYLLMKKRKREAAIVGVAIVLLLIGLVLVYFSPGSIDRRASWGARGEAATLGHVVVGSLGHYSAIMKTWGIWKILLLVFSVIVAAFFLKIKDRKLGLFVLGTVFVSSTYLVFAASNYVSDYVAFRLMTLPTFGIVASLALVGPMIRWGESKKWLVIGAYALAGVVAVGCLVENTNGIEALALRRRLVNLRNEAYSEQLASGEARVEIVTAPAIWFRHDAVDLAVHEGGELNFVARTYKNLAGVDELVILDAPDWYLWGGKAQR